MATGPEQGVLGPVSPIGPLREVLLPKSTTGVGGARSDSVSGSLPHSMLSNKIARMSTRFSQPQECESASDKKAALIIRVSLAVNVALFVAKLYCWLATGSLAVLASFVDSAIDLIAQTVILVANFFAERSTKSNKVDTIYPVGMSRVEPLGVVICAVLMVLASFEVVQTSISTLIAYCHSPDGPPMDFTNSSGAMLIGVIVLKIILWRWCVSASKSTNNVSLEAISLDNWNDVISNTAALMAAMMTRGNQHLWLADPIGAIAISAYIIWAWLKTAAEQIDMLVGKQASPEFLSVVREIAETHDPSAQLDVVRAYHFGPKFLVEIELVMDRKTPLQVSHDVGMLLQHRIEHMEDCERCFVHIDYEHRADDDHDPSVPLSKKICMEKLGSEGQQEEV